MKGLGREDFDRFDEYENSSADWYSDRMADKYESNKADMTMLNDIFDCGMDSRIERYTNSVAGICF